LSKVVIKTSDQARAAHWVFITWAKIAGSLTTNGNSIFVEYSAKDIHFSGKNTPATTYYQKLDTKTPKYFGLTLNDKIVEDFLMEFFLRRQEQNLIELLSLFPDFDTLTT
jgi:hypothetical protein